MDKSIDQDWNQKIREKAFDYAMKNGFCISSDVADFILNLCESQVITPLQDNLMSVEQARKDAADKKIAEVKTDFINRLETWKEKIVKSLTNFAAKECKTPGEANFQKISLEYGHAILEGIDTIIDSMKEPDDHD